MQNITITSRRTAYRWHGEESQGRLSTAKKKDHYILHSSFLFFQTNPSTVTPFNQQVYPPSMVPQDLAKYKIKSSLSVIDFFFFFLSHAKYDTSLVHRKHLDWKEFPDSLRVTSSANSFFPSATEEQIAPVLLPLEEKGEKTLSILSKTNKAQKASKMDSERFFVLVCKHGLPQYQDLA